MIFEDLPKSRPIITVLGPEFFPRQKKASTELEKPRHWESKPVFVHFHSSMPRFDLHFWVKLVNFGFLHL